MLGFLLLQGGSCTKSATPHDEILEPIDCLTENPIDRGDRSLGLDLLDLTEIGDFDENMQLARELHADFLALHLSWTSIETGINQYEDPGSALALLAHYARNSNMKFSITVKPIDATGKTIPPDLEKIRFNDPRMAIRFMKVIDFIVSAVEPQLILSLQIGNEVDLYDTSQEHDEFWLDYGVFLADLQSSIRQKYSDLKIGVTATHPGLIKSPKTFQKLAENVEILGVTYYPLQSNFDVKSPDIVFSDLDNLMSKYDNQTIYLQEIGYQTSSDNHSSEGMQAEFFCNFFKAWDDHYDRIKVANIVRLNDLSPEAAIESGSAYQLHTKPFFEYLRTLGTRSYEGHGSNKKTFDVIKNNLIQRRW